jgi:hypothetical protein
MHHLAVTKERPTPFLWKARTSPDGSPRSRLRADAVSWGGWSWTAMSFLEVRRSRNDDISVDVRPSFGLDRTAVALNLAPELDQHADDITGL